MDALLPLWPLVCGPMLIAALAVPPVKRLAWRCDLVDRPEAAAHKSHEQPTPYGGAIAIACGLFLTLGVALPYGLPPLRDYAMQDNIFWLVDLVRVGSSFVHAGGDLWIVLLGGGALLLSGLIDDWRGLPPLTRLLAQLGIIAIVVFAAPACRLALFPDAPYLNFGLTVLWIGAMANAFNFLDNMDGLSAGIAAIALIVLSFMAFLLRDFALATLCLALLGALCGFLLYNLPPATIFMGDAGGLFLGFCTSAAAAILSRSYAEATLYGPYQLAPLLVLAVPVYDFASVNLIRIRSGAKPWIGDKNHISHRLVRAGLSRRGAVLAIYALTGLTALPALLALRFDENYWLSATAILIGLLAIADNLRYTPPE
ncbi:MAG: MraY family glycosyltransferase [Candidatus Latescibacteria bacterium]|nr:MraY family glycosyltransferase [Candidatus Latescibacterota bacterium]